MTELDFCQNYKRLNNISIRSEMIFVLLGIQSFVRSLILCWITGSIMAILAAAINFIYLTFLKGT